MDTAIGKTAERVLVVDDNPVICEALAMALTDEGFDATPRFGVQEALTAARGADFALAFVDVRLPGMSGMELAVKLRELLPALELVFISAAGTTNDLIRAMQTGAFDYILKPFTPDSLRLTLERYRERRALKRRLELAEQRHTTLLHSIPLVIYSLREDLSLSFINHAARLVLGFTPEEAMSTPNWFIERVSQQDRPRVSETLRHAFASHEPLSVECRLTHRQGFDVHGYVKTMPATQSATDEAGTRHLDGIFMDITERVHLERLTAQDARLSTIGAISDEVAHEIRNPLMAIGGFARRLHAKAPDMPETEIILRESLRLEKLLDRIRGYLDPMPITTQPANIHDILTGCIGTHLPVLEQSGVEVVVDIAEVLPQALADPDALCRVLGILLGDAAKTLAHGRELTIRALYTPKSVFIRVSYALADQRDMNPERLDLPFEDGGLGLPLCYRLVKQMGGLMTMTRENGSAAFTINLNRLPPAV
ncbi:PAS domain S-box-containing protein [Desulfobaculum xiamenense]|uniref:histidine kinase n=1 Tax=Desulfobaculum xiamenense TaxID=995050 RepID=A0A846QHB3_9BACT|nr:PAS domain S-box-containing protein [Desulfobaculum xiamenense]